MAHSLASRFAVLVVDDEVHTRALVSEYLESEGFDVTVARDGAEAVALLQQSDGRFGLVVTDLNMPGVDGLGVLQLARQERRDCFVVVVTGQATVEAAMRAVRVGAFDFLEKPFSFTELGQVLSHVHETCEERDAERAAQAVPAMVASAAGNLDDRLASLEQSVRALEQRVTAA